MINFKFFRGITSEFITDGTQPRHFVDVQIRDRSIRIYSDNRRLLNNLTNINDDVTQSMEMKYTMFHNNAGTTEAFRTMIDTQSLDQLVFLNQNSLHLGFTSTQVDYIVWSINHSRIIERHLHERI